MNPLVDEVHAVARQANLLRAGAVLHPAMPEVAETRFGRVVAAQLASLALRRHLWFTYGGEHVGPAGLLASTRPDAVDTPDPDEEVLLGLLFSEGPVTRLAAPRAGARWDALADGVRRGVAEAGMGWMRRERYRFLRRLRALRTAMRAHADEGPRFEDDPALHRAGYPWAVLFAVETGIPHWPPPAESEVYLPALLPIACHLGIEAAT